MEVEELVESLRAEEASIEALFSEGRSLSRRGPDYERKFVAAAKLVGAVMAGKMGSHYLREAMSTDDFPYLFGDILDRSVLAAYREAPADYDQYINVNPNIRDFRTISRHYSDEGGGDVLSEVKELAPYPHAEFGEGRYQYSVNKYGRKMGISWEMLINDDLGLIRDIPIRLGRAARRSEWRFATDLFVGTTGPDGTFYSGGNGNVVTSNPVLSLNAFQTAMTVLSAMRDSAGEPIVIDMVHLVVPPALEVVAQNILNATQLVLRENGGGTNTELQVANWMRNRVTLHVNPYIPVIASSSNGNTSWFLFASPNNGRPAAEVGFLRGHREPEVFIKSPNAQRTGGGVDPMAGDFDYDGIEYKVRHVFGGTLMDPKMSVASNGSGS